MSKKLYIMLISVHGLVRGKNIEFGRNADTGGQVKYVIELAKALGRRDDVRKVDLFTRLIRDKTTSPDYAKKIEEIDEKVRIVRIQCGGKKYIRKEMLWPHLDEYVDKTLKFIKDQKDIPHVVHGHYADAGYIARVLSAFWGVPLIFTGHSLGRVKKSNLDYMAAAELEKKFNISTRIEKEEEIIQSADRIITSTSQEVAEQYGMYESSAMARFKVIPPGTDLSKFKPFYDEHYDDEAQREQVSRARYFLEEELNRFLTHPEKPLIIALSRPDKRKNIPALIHAYGTNKELQIIANLAVFAGIRKDITSMDENEREVLTELLLLMDRYDLYGKMAVPKRHDVEYEVPELYRLAARKNGVFVNPTFKENFGLTLIEAASSGLPVVATDNGGPQDIISNCKNGILVDVSKPEQISEAIKKILIDRDLWKKYSENGLEAVREHYSWSAHCETYINELKTIPMIEKKPEKEDKIPASIGRRFTHLTKFFITDIDDTLLGDKDAIDELMKIVDGNRDKIGFGVATGRPIESAIAVLEEHNVRKPDIMITSVGTEIYYGEKLMPDKGWQSHIGQNWQREKIETVLDGLDFLNKQEDSAQRPFKLSYYMEPSGDNLARVHKALTDKKLRYNLIYSREMYLDVLPQRAAKGKAIRYLSYKWNIALSNILVSGDSDNDEDMLRGEMKAVVVGNHHKDLDKLKGLRNVYFSEENHARGILDGFRHYKFSVK